MVKNFKIILSIIFIISFLGFSIDVYAQEQQIELKNVIGYSNIPNGAKIKKFSIRKHGNKEIHEIIYDYLDLTDIVDTTVIIRSNFKSANGSNTVTRTKKQGKRWSITIKATFSWGNEKAKCDDMSASKTTNYDYVCSKFEQDKGDSSWLPFSKAYAKVDYDFYSSSNPVLFNKGTFEVTCSKNGDISDN